WGMRASRWRWSTCTPIRTSFGRQWLSHRFEPLRAEGAARARTCDPAARLPALPVVGADVDEPTREHLQRHAVAVEHLPEARGGESRELARAVREEEDGVGVGHATAQEAMKFH